jgi:hypothetical protein
MVANKWRRPFSAIAGLAKSLRNARDTVAPDAPAGWPAGHFYSPIASLADVRRREGRIFNVPTSLAGIDLNDEGQCRTVAAIAAHFSVIVLPEKTRPGIRFYYDNPNIGHGEALIYSALLRQVRPKRVIEIGSGFSTLLLLDTLDQLRDNATSCTCIEPYPDLLHSLISSRDSARIEIRACAAQDADLAWFEGLQSGDILFVDSTHVSKVGSDVNHILFEILPRLNSGVYVHFHDVYYPFEYPKKWVFEGRNWNEAYLLRGFLQFNSGFTIQCFNSYLGHFHPELFRDTVPLFLENPGSSLWLRRA